MTLRPAIGLVCAVFALGGCERSPNAAATAAIGNAHHGAEIIREKSCGACHTIPGIRGAYGTVGPPLKGFARRSFIAGVLPNTPDNVVRWVVDPPAIQPTTAMPALGIAPKDARDVAAFLYGLN